MKPWQRIACAILSSAWSTTAVVSALATESDFALPCLIAGLCFAALLFIDDYHRWRDDR